MQGKTITFSLTEKDIKQGVRASCYQCPIAKALRRVVPNAIEISVLGRAAIISSIGNETVLPLSKKATRFINAFDAGKKVKPANFRLLAITAKSSAPA